VLLVVEDMVNSNT